MVIYIILIPLQNTIYMVDSWTKNPFIAKRYFKQFEIWHPGAVLREYKCNSHLDLIKRFMFDARVIVSVTEFPDLELMTKMSYDSKLTMVYRNVHKSMVDDAENVKSALFKYYYDELLERHDRLCNYINNDIGMMSIQNTQIDLVYAWRILMEIRKKPWSSIVVFIEE